MLFPPNIEFSTVTVLPFNDIAAEESIVIASLASISNVVESMSIGLSAAAPIAIDVAESIVKAPLASISKVFPEPPTVIFVLSAESIDNVLEPSIVIAPLASISNAAEFISTVCPVPFNNNVPQ